MRESILVAALRAIQEDISRFVAAEREQHDPLQALLAIQEQATQAVCRWAQEVK